MEPSSKSSNETSNGVASVILILQLFAWLFAVSYFYGDYSGSDAAGNGMARGMTALLVTVPSMIFIFFSNLYLMLKKYLGSIFRYIAVANILGLVVLVGSINW